MCKDPDNKRCRSCPPVRDTGCPEGRQGGDAGRRGCVSWQRARLPGAPPWQRGRAERPGGQPGLLSVQTALRPSQHRPPAPHTCGPHSQTWFPSCLCSAASDSNSQASVSSPAKWGSWPRPCRGPGHAPSGPCLRGRQSTSPSRRLAPLTVPRSDGPVGARDLGVSFLSPLPRCPQAQLLHQPLLARGSGNAPGTWGPWHRVRLPAHPPRNTRRQRRALPARALQERDRYWCVDSVSPGTCSSRGRGWETNVAPPAVQSRAAPPEEGALIPEGPAWPPLPRPGLPSSVLSLLLMGEAQVPTLLTTPLLLRPPPRAPPASSRRFLAASPPRP